MSNSIQSGAIVEPLFISSRLALIEGLLPDPNSMLFKKRKLMSSGIALIAGLLDQMPTPCCSNKLASSRRALVVGFAAKFQIQNANSMLFKQTRKTRKRL
jgi:hypothetical protein